jgi:hypothetical protein
MIRTSDQLLWSYEVWYTAVLKIYLMMPVMYVNACSLLRSIVETAVKDVIGHGTTAFYCKVCYCY